MGKKKGAAAEIKPVEAKPAAAAPAKAPEEAKKGKGGKKK